MSDGARRKELQAQYKQKQPEAGVYRIVNTINGKALLGSTPDLGSMRSKVAFAHSTNTSGVLFHQMREDINTYGIGAFSFEVLEALAITPEMTRAEILRDLAALEELWREKFDPALLY